MTLTSSLLCVVVLATEQRRDPPYPFITDKNKPLQCESLAARKPPEIQALNLETKHFVLLH